MMKNSLIVILVASLIVGCRSIQVPISSTSDSSSTKIQYDSIYVQTYVDTVYITPPLEFSSVLTDTASRLETSLAISFAGLRGGKLFHSIENKRDPIAFLTTRQDIYKYKLVQAEDYKISKVEVPIRLPLTAWQRAWISTGQVLTALLLGFLTLKLRKILLNLLRHFHNPFS